MTMYTEMVSLPCTVLRETVTARRLAFRMVTGTEGEAYTPRTLGRVFCDLKSLNGETWAVMPLWLAIDKALTDKRGKPL